MADERSELDVAKRAPPPAELPRINTVDPIDTSFFAESNFEDTWHRRGVVFGILRNDRPRHMYVVGKSGMGKTKLLEHLIRADVYYGYGVGVIDPHGDLHRAILSFIPPDRVEDVIVIDPADDVCPVAFNPFRGVRFEYRHLVADGLIEIFRKRFGATWTPRVEHVFRFASYAMIDYPHGTFDGMLRLLTDRRYRQAVTDAMTDEVVQRFWAIEFAGWSERFESEAIVPLVNILSQFLSNPRIRAIFGQEENRVDFAHALNDGKIILVSLAKGMLGEDNAGLFGAIIITKIAQVAMERARVTEEERVPFYLYVDEFHNVATETFANLFAESRKFGICMTVANQYLAQLPERLRTTVLGNAGTLITFRLGAEDAAVLEHEFAPVFTAKDLINLGMQEIYVKMPVNGKLSDPFSAETILVRPPKHESSERRILEHSCAVHGVRKSATPPPQAKTIPNAPPPATSSSASEFPPLIVE